MSEEARPEEPGAAVAGEAALLRERRFWPLFAGQALVALAQNLFRGAATIVILEAATAGRGPMLVSVAMALYFLPFVLLSATAGGLADRMVKARLAERVLLAQLPAALLGALGLVLGAPSLLLLALLGMGAQAALFGPVKYALLPELLRPGELVAGNGLVAASTFLAVLAGSVLGTVLVALPAGELLAGLLTTGLAGLAWAFGRLLPERPAAAPLAAVARDPLAAARALLADLAARPGPFRAARAISWFWAMGGLYLAQLPAYATSVLGEGEGTAALLLTLLSVGIGAGALAVRRLAGATPSLAPVPMAALALALFSLDLALVAGTLAREVVLGPPLALLARPAGWRLLLDLTAVAAASGFLVVPLMAWLQASLPADRRASLLGATALLNALYMVAAAALSALLLWAGVSIAGLFLLTALGNLLLAVQTVRYLPGHTIRSLFRLLFKLAFRLEVAGAEHLAGTGPRTLVLVNHVSLLDGPLMMAVAPEPPAFAVWWTWLERWWLAPFAEAFRLIPVDPARPQHVKVLVAAVEEGRPLVIFPEGRISVTGALMKIYAGPAWIADRTGAVIVPVRIDGAEVTPFSRLTRGQVRRRWFPKIKITVLPPRRLGLDPTLRGRARRQRAALELYEIMSAMVFETTDLGHTLLEAVVRARARHGGGLVVAEDVKGTSLTYERLLVAALALARRLERETVRGEVVGLFLPNACATAAVFLALQAIGRVPAMLNVAAGSANLLSACATARIRLVLSAREFVEQARLEAPIEALGGQARLLWLEDLRQRIGRGERLRAWLGARRPLAFHRRFAVRREEPAVVLFTSGSEGRPKAVLLSHGNLLANCAQVAARVDFSEQDRCFNALPLFHSFGLTGGFLMPLLHGVRLFLYPSPLHYRIVPEAIYNTNATILFGTNAFLKGYGRAADPYDFRSLRYVFAGAEPLQEETRLLWFEKFGIRILVGYGATETGPVLAVNTPMHHRPGTVGRFLPGIAWRILPVPGLERGGRLLVRGPNIMLGYLLPDRPGEIAPPDDGWYDTGDLVDVDPEGFVTILGRARRFAKIGGEMVSLAAAEDLVSELVPEAGHAVVAVSDPRKGERLVLVTTAKGLDRARLARGARRAGRVELMVPAEVVEVDELPRLATGKTDYPAVQRLVAGLATAAG